jgi:hypothetical protein
VLDCQCLCHIVCVGLRSSLKRLFCAGAEPPAYMLLCHVSRNATLLWQLVRFEVDIQKISGCTTPSCLYLSHMLHLLLVLAPRHVPRLVFLLLQCVPCIFLGAIPASAQC